MVLILLLASLMLASNVWAQPTALAATPADPAKVADRQAARRQALTHDRESAEQSRQDLLARLADLPRQMEALRPEQIDEAMLEQTRVDAESARLRQESALSELSNSRRRIEDLQKGIGELEAREQLLKNPAKDAAEGAADRAEQLRQTSLALTQQRADLELETLNLANLRDQIDIAKLRLKLAEQWRERIERTFQQRQEQGRQSAQAELVGRLQTDLATQQDRANALRQRLSQNQGALPLALWQRLVTELRTVEEHINLLSLDRHLAETANVLARLKDLPNNASTDPDDLRDALEQLAAMRDDLRRTEELLQRKSTVHEQQRQVIERREATTTNDRRLRGEELQLAGQLLTDLSQRAGQAQDQLLQLGGITVQLDQNYRERLRRDLLTRKPYPETVDAWRQLLEAMATVPQVLFYQIQLSLESTIRALLDATVLRWAVLAVLEGMLVWGLMAAGRGLRQTSRRLGEQRIQGDSFLRQLIASALLLARANLGGAGCAAALLLLLWLAEAPQPGFGILMTLALSWLGIKLPVSLAWLLLVSPRLPVEQRQPALYRQLFWTLIGGGALVALVALAHLSDLSAMVVNAFDRLFMLYWFWAFLPVLRIRRLVMDLLGALYGERLWFVMLRFGSLLLPLSLLGAAVLGLLGYLRLAWLVAGYLLIFIAALVGWLLARSLLNDLAVALKNFAVTHSGYGLLWTQDIITPLHRILNLLLFLGAWVVLFRAYGWNGESAVVASIRTFLERPLFIVGAAEITTWRILITVTILLVVIWLGQWSRAISYRWVLSHISDLGVRHSLSVFAQYAVVLVGLLFILRVVGIDLTTLAVFAGAVGVGIGLGMQSLANNFVSGLLLLIERPLRSGDIVQVGTHLGEVTSIGMRSLTVQTFDNESVIIPNAEVIGSAFTNWTHGDRVLRTILWVGISYDADPHQAQNIIERILREHPAVLAEPEPLALLWDFADSSVKFRVQYFIDLGRNHLLKTQNEILFSVWDRFKEFGIRIPYPQHDLYLKEWPASGPAGLTPPLRNPGSPSGGAGSLSTHHTDATR
ncbi:MAG: mechanosensitive ion channel [Candidatus Competibacter sp.]|nr:mechanosensitive ion channel [Candidatus Competibacter sp.]MDG4583039.1 mechanosensitive ion channel [Candidatus Competibacter sp.]